MWQENPLHWNEYTLKELMRFYASTQLWQWKQDLDQPWFFLLKMMYDTKKIKKHG